MESCEIDQFEMHIRAVMNMPCPPPKMKVGAALMLNILGTTFLCILLRVFFVFFILFFFSILFFIENIVFADELRIIVL